MPSSGGQTCALRSEEHTSELQSLTNLVCRLLLEKNILGTCFLIKDNFLVTTKHVVGEFTSDLFILFPHILFFFNDTATSEIYSLSLPDALPIFHTKDWSPPLDDNFKNQLAHVTKGYGRSEEHTSELQSRSDIVYRLLLAKK